MALDALLVLPPPVERVIVEQEVLREPRIVGPEGGLRELEPGRTDREVLARTLTSAERRRRVVGRGPGGHEFRHDVRRRHRARRDVTLCLLHEDRAPGVQEDPAERLTADPRGGRLVAQLVAEPAHLALHSKRYDCQSFGPPRQSWDSGGQRLGCGDVELGVILLCPVKLGGEPMPVSNDWRWFSGADDELRGSRSPKGCVGGGPRASSMRSRTAPVGGRRTELGHDRTGP